MDGSAIRPTFSVICFYKKGVSPLQEPSRRSAAHRHWKPWTKPTSIRSVDWKTDKSLPDSFPSLSAHLGRNFSESLGGPNRFVGQPFNPRSPPSIKPLRSSPGVHNTPSCGATSAERGSDPPSARSNRLPTHLHLGVARSAFSYIMICRRCCQHRRDSRPPDRASFRVVVGKAQADRVTDTTAIPRDGAVSGVRTSGSVHTGE
jgi:hypothetical protein